MINKSFLCKAIALLCMISLLSSSNYQTVFANETNPLTDSEIEARVAYIDDNIHRLSAYGPEYVDAFLEENGIIEAEFLQNSPNSRSTGGNATVTVNGYWEKSVLSIIRLYKITNILL